MIRFAAVMSRSVFFAAAVSFQNPSAAAAASSPATSFSFASRSKIPPQVFHPAGQILYFCNFSGFRHSSPAPSSALEATKYVPPGKPGRFTLSISGLRRVKQPCRFPGTYWISTSCGIVPVNIQYVVCFLLKIVLTCTGNNHIFYYCLRGDRTPITSQPPLLHSKIPRVNQTYH